MTMKFGKTTAPVSGDVEFVESSGDHNFAICVCEEGVFIRGESPKFKGKGDLEGFAKAIGDAVKCYQMKYHGKLGIFRTKGKPNGEEHQ